MSVTVNNAEPLASNKVLKEQRTTNKKPTVFSTLIRPWARLSVLPLLVLACWSREWLAWGAIVPITMALFWGWWQPRLFPVYDNDQGWALKALLGEQAWLNRHNMPVPKQHSRIPQILSFLSASACVPLIWGIITLHIWPTLLGMACIYLVNYWRLDRMVWLYEDMCNIQTPYRWMY